MICVSKLRPIILISFIPVLLFSYSLSGRIYAQGPSVICTAEANGNPYQICEYSNLLLHAMEENGQQGTYFWAGPNNFQSTQQNPILLNILPAATGTYSVTFTNSQNQTSTCTLDLIVRNCCLTPNSPSNFVTGPISQVVPIDFTLPVICNNLLIDIDYEFPSASNLIFTDEISEISLIVNSGKNLTLKNSQIHGCNGVYKGIIVEPEAYAKIDGCYFEYGTHMIIAKGKSGLTVTNSHFHANHISIDIPPPSDPTQYQYVLPFILSGNIFECTNDIIPSGEIP